MKIDLLNKICKSLNFLEKKTEKKKRIKQNILWKPTKLIRLNCLFLLQLSLGAVLFKKNLSKDKDHD